jgi:hypothetical protein
MATGRPRVDQPTIGGPLHVDDVAGHLQPFGLDSNFFTETPAGQKPDGRPAGPRSRAGDYRRGSAGAESPSRHGRLFVVQRPFLAASDHRSFRPP